MKKTPKKNTKNVPKPTRFHKSNKKTLSKRQAGGLSRKLTPQQKQLIMASLSCMNKEYNNNSTIRRNGFVGVHATGTGKTLTGVVIIKNLLEHVADTKILLVVPEKLIANWKNEIFNLISKQNHKQILYKPLEKFNEYLQNLSFHNDNEEDTKKTVVIIDEAHLLVESLFRTEEFMAADTSTMQFSDLHPVQQTLLTLSTKSHGVILLTATPIVHSILDLRWMYNIAKGYDTGKVDTEASVPINRLNFCNKFTTVSAKYEMFKKIVDFLNSEGVQSSISRIVMLTNKSSRSGFDTVLLTGNLISLASGIGSVTSNYNNEKQNLSTRRINELAQTTVSNYQVGSVLYNLVLGISSGTKSGSSASSLAKYYLVILAMYIVSNLLSKQLNSIKYPGEKDLFLTRIPKKEVLEHVLQNTFHFYDISKEESQHLGFPKEVRIDRMMVDYTLEQRFLFYRFCNGQLSDEDCDLLFIPKEKREKTYEEIDKSSKEHHSDKSLKRKQFYRLLPQTLGRKYDEEYFGLKIGNLGFSSTETFSCVKYEEVFNQIQSMNENVRRVGVYSNYNDSILEFNKFLLLKLEKNEGKREKMKNNLSSIFFLEPNCNVDTMDDEILKMCSSFDSFRVVSKFDGSLESMRKQSNIVDSEEDIPFITIYTSLLPKTSMIQRTPLTIQDMKKALEKMIKENKKEKHHEFYSDNRIVKLFNTIQRWSLYCLNKEYNVYYLGDVNQYTRIVEEFNHEDLKYTGYILLHPKWIEGITLKRVQQFHILEPSVIYANQVQIRGRVARLGTHMDPEFNTVRICEWFCNDNLLTSFLTSSKSTNDEPIKARKEDSVLGSAFREIKFLGTQYLNPFLKLESIYYEALERFKMYDFSNTISYIRGKTKEASDYYIHPDDKKASNNIPSSLEAVVMNRSYGLENLFNLLKNNENLKNIEICGRGNQNICKFDYDKTDKTNQNIISCI